jgi:hypothetical protein
MQVRVEQFTHIRPAVDLIHIAQEGGPGEVFQVDSEKESEGWLLEAQDLAEILASQRASLGKDPSNLLKAKPLESIL